MTIRITTRSYSASRGKPWVARILDWDTGGRPPVKWGEWLGRTGSPGTLEIEAEPGDVIMHGLSGMPTEYAVVEFAGGLTYMPRDRARAHWLARAMEADSGTNT